MRLLDEWEGVHPELAVPCPICPTVIPPDRPRGHFPLEAIYAFRSENPGLATMFCNTCRKNAKIEQLLSGWSEGTSPLEQVATRLGRIEGKIDELLLREPQTATEAAEQFRRLYEFLTDQRRIAPSTFTAICEEAEGWFASLSTGMFRVTLWCENPDGPHPVVPIGSGSEKNPVSGEYLIKFSKDWVKRWAPRLKWGLLTLKAAVPVAGAVLKAGLDEALFKDIEKRLNLGEKAMAALPAGELTTSRKPKLEPGLMESLTGSDLREFHATMADHFKDGKWGDLEYAELPDKSWRWMCKKCRARLSPGPQKSLGIRK